MFALLLLIRKLQQDKDHNNQTSHFEILFLVLY